MTLTLRVLGAATPYPAAPDQPCSGYLVQTPDTNLLVELGLGVWPHLLQHLDPADLTGVWISHLHPDHSADLLALYQWAANSDNPPRLPVHGPQGWADRIGAALPAEDGADQFRRLFHVHEHVEAPIQLGDLSLTAIQVHHSVPAYGLRIRANGATLAYSGDSGPCAQLTDLAESADLFLCEAGSSTSGQPYHCTPEEAARAGQAARRLVLTHLSPGLTAANAADRAGGATIAHPGLVIPVAPAAT